jgi:hypothetical protein
LVQKWLARARNWNSTAAGAAKSGFRHAIFALIL